MALILQNRRLPMTSSPTSGGPLLASLVEAKEQTRAFLEPERLADTVDAMVGHAHDLDASLVYGASDAGHVICGAMALRSPRLRIWQPGGAGSVLLIDAFVASLAGLYVAAGRAEVVGAECTHAVVLGLVPEERLAERRVGRVIAMRHPGAPGIRYQPAAA